MRTSKLILVLLLALIIALSACQLPAPPDSEEARTDPQSIFTAAAQTADIRLAQMALTVVPTRTSLPTALPTLTPTIGPTMRVLTTTLTGPVTILPPEADRAELVADLSVPDGTVFKPTETFVKTWRFRNVGTTTWTSQYSLAFMYGDLMGGPLSMPLPKPVAPGGVLDLPVELVAPIEERGYEGHWALMNANGQVFGIGPNGDETFWVKINVVGKLPTETPTPSPTPRAISGLSLSVDNPTYSGPCPHTFVFTVQIVLTKPSILQYRLKTENDAGVELNLPMPARINVQDGTHTTLFELTLAQSVNGWLRVVILEPEQLESKQVNFQLTCQ